MQGSRLLKWLAPLGEVSRLLGPTIGLTVKSGKLGALLLPGAAHFCPTPTLPPTYLSEVKRSQA